jgi:hypothetical protein
MLPAGTSSPTPAKLAENITVHNQDGSRSGQWQRDMTPERELPAERKRRCDRNNKRKRAAKIKLDPLLQKKAVANQKGHEANRKVKLAADPAKAAARQQQLEGGEANRKVELAADPAKAAARQQQGEVKEANRKVELAADPAKAAARQQQLEGGEANRKNKLAEEPTRAARRKRQSEMKEVTRKKKLAVDPEALRRRLEQFRAAEARRQMLNNEASRSRHRALQQATSLRWEPHSRLHAKPASTLPPACMAYCSQPTDRWSPARRSLPPVACSSPARQARCQIVGLEARKVWGVMIAWGVSMDALQAKALY